MEHTMEGCESDMDGIAEKHVTEEMTEYTGERAGSTGAWDRIDRRKER